VPEFRRAIVIVLVLWAGILVPTSSSAQAFTIEAGIERLTVLDDTGRVPYNGAGLAARGQVGPRIGLGAGVSMLGRATNDRLVVVRAQMSVDLLASTTDRVAMPFVAVSAGVLNQSRHTSLRKSTSISFTAELTAGVRLRVSDRWFVAPWAGLGVTAYPLRRIGFSGGVVF
jgi:hypothetical protein